MIYFDDDAMRCGRVKKMSDKLEKLRDDVRRLEIQMAALSNINNEKIISDVTAGSQPHEAAGKCQRCKSCTHMRMPHRSNEHYSCMARHANIEPNWTCGLYNDKRES